MSTDNDIRTAIQRLKEQRGVFLNKLTQVDNAIRVLSELIGEPLTDDVSISTVLPETPLGASVLASPTERTKTPQFASGVFFGMTQRQAATEVLRRFDCPMAMIEIVEVLKREKFAFETQNPYQSMFKTMSRSKDFVKHGKQWQLKGWAGRRGESGNLLKNISERIGDLIEPESNENSEANSE